MLAAYVTKAKAHIAKSSLMVVLSLVLVLPLICLSAWISLQIWSTLDRNTSLLSTALDLKAGVNDLLPLLLEQDDATKAMLIDPTTLETFSAKKIDAYDKHTKLLESLYASTTDGTIRHLIDRLRQFDSDKLRPLDTQILELLFENVDKARASYFASYEPNRAVYEKDLHELIVAVSASADHLTNEIRSENILLTRKVILAMALGILSIIAVIVVLARLLQQSRSNTEVLLASLNEGMFFFDQHGTIATERTAALEKILPGAKAAQTLAEICQLAAGSKPGNVAMCLQLLWPKAGDDGFVSDFESSISFLPQAVVCLIAGEARNLVFEYRPQYGRDGKTLMRVVVVASDVTVKLRLERDAVTQAERVRKIAKAATNMEAFQEFTKELITLMRRADGELAKAAKQRDMAQLKRDLHTIKGTVGTYEFTSLAAAVHSLESEIDDPTSENPEQDTLSRWDVIKDMWKFESSGFYQVLGLDQARSRLSISAATYGRLCREAVAAGQQTVVESLTRLRCFPLEEIFSHYQEYLGKLCERRGNKQVRLSFQKDSVELSHEEVKGIDGALVHLFRNCLDHGIEDFAARKALGKDMVGHIHISAYRTTAGMLHVILKDDGGGVDGDKLGRKAVGAGLWTEAQFAAASQQQKVELMFATGLSTAEQVSDISGRGVGMDAVKTMLEQLGGKITVYSMPRLGTQFELDVPLLPPWNQLVRSLEEVGTAHAA